LSAYLRSLQPVVDPSHNDHIPIQATLQGLVAKFSQATDIMKWLKQAASMTTKLTKQPVTWTTPLGLRCVQPYLKDVRSGCHVSASCNASYLTSECCASAAVTASALFASMLGGRCCAGTVEQYNAAAPGSLMSRMSLHQCVGSTLTRFPLAISDPCCVFWQCSLG